MGMERLKVGVKGLDEALGGFPKGRTTLVTGNAGSGKTIFGLQFSDMCCRNGLRTVHIATEEVEQDLEIQGTSFGWDFRSYKKKGLFTFVELTRDRIMDVESMIGIQVEARKGNFEGLLQTVPDGTQVLVIDSLGSHTANLTPREFKDRLDLLIHRLNEKDITALLVLDSATSKEYNDLAMFSVYGAIELQRRENPYTGRRERVMDIVKMRNTRTPIQLLAFDISENGIVIVSADEKSNL